MDIADLARSAGLAVLLDARIGEQSYESVSGPLAALRRFGDVYCSAPAVDVTDAATLPALFERWATLEGLPLTKSLEGTRKYVWPQTEQAWFGFQGLASVLDHSKVV